MTDKDYLTAIAAYVPLGPLRISLLLKYFKTAEKIWHADRDELMSLGLSNKLVLGFDKHRKNFEINSYLDLVSKKKINVLSKYDKDYPKNMVSYDDSPHILYVRGDRKILNKKSVAIVGSRKMTSYGKEITMEFSRKLSQKGIVIISGLAMGVDAVAHDSCIRVGGKTIAVLASGVDIITPNVNSWLGQKIITSGGAIVSEYPLAYIPEKYDFPNRNRIISAMADVIVVVEGLEKSGTIHTAVHAVNQGKTVFAVPGRINTPTSAAPHFLIRNGARVAFGVEDIFEELGVN